MAVRYLWVEIVLQSVEAAVSAAEADGGADTPAAGTAGAAAARRIVGVLVGIPGGTAAVGTESSADKVWVAGTGTVAEAVASTGMGHSIPPVSSFASP